MKTYSAALIDALLAGGVIAAGAVKIATATNPALIWSGHGPLVLDDGGGPEEYVGVGQHGLVSVTGGQLGSAEQGIEMTLSGVDPENIAVLAEIDVRRAPVVLWRVFFDSSGTTLLDAHVFARGRVDGLPIEETPGGTAKIALRMETAVRGLGRRTGRMRADADQRLIDGADGGFRQVTAAPSKTLAWGGKPPMRAGSVLNGTPINTVALDAVRNFHL